MSKNSKVSRKLRRKMLKFASSKFEEPAQFVYVRKSEYERFAVATKDFASVVSYCVNEEQVECDLAVMVPSVQFHGLLSGLTAIVCREMEQYGIHRFVVSAIISPAMEQWCKKWGMVYVDTSTTTYYIDWGDRECPICSA